MADGLEGYALGPLERAWIEHIFATGMHVVRSGSSPAIAAVVVNLLSGMQAEILRPTRTSTFTYPRIDS